MRYTTLKYAVAGRIARITLNRPARLNAIDDKVHVILLAGAGKAFCAGYDLKKFAEGDPKNKQYAKKHGFHAAVKWRDSGKAIP